MLSAEEFASRQQHSNSTREVDGEDVVVVSEDSEVASTPVTMQGETSLSSSSNASESVEAHEDLISAIADALSREVFGSFFEFNDSEVKPMSLADVRLAFEGKDCAYLVVYRQEDKCRRISERTPQCVSERNNGMQASESEPSMLSVGMADFLTKLVNKSAPNLPFLNFF